MVKKLLIAGIVIFVAGQSFAMDDTVKQKQLDEQLWNAIKKGEDITTLVEAGANVHARKGYDNYTTLHWAAKYGNVLAVKKLIDLDLKVDVKDKDDRTPLTYTVKSPNPGSADVINVLCKHGASVNVRSDFGNSSTLLHKIFVSGSLDTRSKEKIVRALVTNGVDVNAKDKNGDTPLHYVSVGNGDHFIPLLIGLGADPNMIGHNNFTPIMRALCHRSLKTVETLVNCGANINFQSDSYGITALHFAAGKYHGYDSECKEMISCLLFLGADYEIKNKNGKNPRDCAIDSENHSVAKFLKDRATVRELIFPLARRKMNCVNIFPGVMNRQITGNTHRFKSRPSSTVPHQAQPCTQRLLK